MPTAGALSVTEEQAALRHHFSFVLEPELWPDIVIILPGNAQKDVDELTLTIAAPVPGPS